MEFSNRLRSELQIFVANRYNNEIANITDHSDASPVCTEIRDSMQLSESNEKRFR